MKISTRWIITFGLAIALLPFLTLAAGPTANISSYTVSNSFISPNSTTSVGALDDTNINLVFSNPVYVDLKIKDSGDNVIKHYFNVTSSTTFSRSWDGKDSGSSFVGDGVYTIEMVYSDIDGVATDTSKTITVDNTSPVVGPISLTPSLSSGPTFFYVSSSTTISATTTDDNLNPATCRYSIDGGSSSVTDPGAYSTVTNSCIFPNINTSTASGVAVSVTDLAGNSFDTSTSWLSLTPETTAPVITLAGNSSLEIQVGESYIEAGATANDNLEGDISSRIIKTGSVDNLKEGVYILKYNVTDNLGNAAAEARRTVTVKPQRPGSHTGGFVLGLNPTKIVSSVAIKATSSSQVLGTSTSKISKLSKAERKIKLLKKRLNLLKIRAYEVKHPGMAQVLGADNEATGTAITSDGVQIDATITSSTTPKKPFWKFW